MIPICKRDIGDIYPIDMRNHDGVPWLLTFVDSSYQPPESSLRNNVNVQRKHFGRSLHQMSRNREQVPVIKYCHCHERTIQTMTANSTIYNVGFVHIRRSSSSRAKHESIDLESLPTYESHL